MYFVRVLAPQPVVAVARKTYLTMPCHKIAIPIVIFGNSFHQARYAGGDEAETVIREMRNRTPLRYSYPIRRGAESHKANKRLLDLTPFTDHVVQFGWDGSRYSLTYKFAKGVCEMSDSG